MAQLNPSICNYGAFGRLTAPVLFAVGVLTAAAFAGCAAPESEEQSNSALQPIAGFGAPTAGTGGFGGFQGGGAGGTGAPVGGTGGAVAGGAIPCEVQTIVAARCQSCHGAQLIGGAPMPLVSLADFQRDYTLLTTAGMVGQPMKAYDAVKMRINRENGTSVMPQGAPMSDTELATLNNWLIAGAPAGNACGLEQPTGGAAGMGVVNPTGGTGGTGGVGGTTATPNQDGYAAINRCEGPGALEAAFEPLVARDGETCYEFAVHNISSPSDTSKFSVPTGESYNQFYYAIPWAPGTVATRFGARFDNLQVLHHWLGFKSSSNSAAGTVAKDVTGTTIGENAELVGGWAVGGCNQEFPADVGLVLPDSGRIMIQWHHYNNTGTQQLDGSAVQWCTKPANQVAHPAGITFLGTENFNGPFGMPAGQVSEFTTTCPNDSGQPITIVGFNPHMHLIGQNMKSVVNRVGGGTELVFDEPFIFDQQVNYDVSPYVVMQPGDSITTTCTFNNNTNANVAFGQSTGQEMCYQFTVSYPYGALNNGTPSLIGASNTCW